MEQVKKLVDKSLKTKAINIKGKLYVDVAQRVIFFNENYPKGSIQTIVEFTEDNLVRCKAVVIPDIDNEKRIFIGHAEEDRISTMVNKTSAVENCETSAVGRALGMMGIGVIEGIASVDEIAKAQNKEKSISPDYPATNKQIEYIEKLATELGDTVIKPKTGAEASKLINDLLSSP